MLLLMLLAAAPTEVRRTYADGTTQELWTWESAPGEGDVTKKEWFHPEGERQRVESFQGGELHGVVKTWDRRGLLLTEATWADGQLHGPSRTWQGPDDERWAVTEQRYAEGEPDGEQLRRHDPETPELKHRYVAGQLHGRQEAWHRDGSMRYALAFEAGEPMGEQRVWDWGSPLEPQVYMRFTAAGPHGDQRYFANSDWQVNTWRDGRLERVEKTHPDSDTPARVSIHRLELRPPDRRDDEQRPTDPLGWQVEEHQTLERRFHVDGSLQLERETEGPHAERLHREWSAGGQLVLEGRGRPSDRVGLWREWYDDGVLHVESEWAEGREGDRRTFDRQGRLRMVETFDYERQRWVVTVYEGDHRAAEGEIDPQVGSYRWGSWTYWRPDGSVRRTEVYGLGPYSGNRAFVHESVEYRPDGTVRCEGDERKLRCSESLANGARQELVVRAIGRPRHGFESWQTESFSFEPRQLDPPTLHGEAVLFDVLDGAGLVLERRIYGADGALQSTECWRSDGSPERVTPGEGCD